jgi:peptidoglycan/LPS O-acetylase OafA/YrhL
VCLLATILLSILVASITYRFIEMPGINLGKKLLNSSKKHKLTADQTN